MPRFYFRLRNDIAVDDEEGLELPDAEAACVHAEKFAVAEAASVVLEQHKLDVHHLIEVTDESGQLLFQIQFGEVVKVES